MKHTHEPVMVLSESVVEATIDLIREDAVLGDETSSWSEVAPTSWEAADRLRALVEFGVVTVAAPTPRAILAALRAFETTFLECA